MAIKRTFLGWARPLCETVPEYLLAGAGAGMLDLRGTVVVVPTRQSSWRLHATLPLAADACGSALLGPEIVTPAVLIEPPPVTGVATSLQSLLAWSVVLKAVKPGELIAFLGAREGGNFSTAWALQVARRLQDLRKELADGGFSIADVMNCHAAMEEAERWSAMADLEHRYARQLEDWRLRDAMSRKLDHARMGRLPPEYRRIVVAAVPDPPKLFMTLLDRWAAAGGAVEVLVGAPEDDASAFDSWGRPLPDIWQTRDIALRDDDIWLEASPDTQAVRISKAIKSGGGVNPVDPAMRPQVAVGVPDRETIAPLQRELAAIGLPAFDPQNRQFADTALFRLVRALLDLRDRPGYAEASALLRLPDILASFGHGGDLLLALDEFQSEHLPVTLDDMRDTAAPLRETLARVVEWHKTLDTADLAGGLRVVLQQVYKNRLLKPENPTDASFQQTVAAFDTGLRELEGAAASGQAITDAAELLLARLKDATIKVERRDERIDLEGWLELAWNPAPLLFVAGLNEGFVPDGHVGDVFLPDTLRHQLDLRDDRLRVARDAYLLTAMIEQRRKEGRVIMLVGKSSNTGDPLRPSRLLFRCPDTKLVARAQLLFKNPPPSHAAEAFAVSFQLDPAFVSSACIDSRCLQKLGPTVFRDYLACPLRFYLRHVLGMKPLDDLAREPDASAFGTLVHAALEGLGQEKRLWACGDSDEMALWLERRLIELVRARYGARPWLGVQLAMDSAVQRLRAFAHKQTAWHAAGWEIFRTTEEKRVCEIGGMTISGRIDRIDRNLRTGAVCVLDYKTTDRAADPDKAHIGSPREGDDLAGAAVPAWLTTGKKDMRWADLQLPLYRELVRAEFGPDVHLGYICLPQSAGDTGFRLWESYSDALHASAIQCAEAVVQRIKAGIFWLPGNIKAGYNDELAGVLLGDPVKSVCRPSNPWRARA